MATIVGLRREKRSIITDEYQVVDIVDGQQRITTLVILYKAISLALDQSDPMQNTVKLEIDKLLIKDDDVCPVLLQTNHDSSELLSNYLRNGPREDITAVNTLAERELFAAIKECGDFVEQWKKNNSLTTLVSHIKNKLTFILHEIDDEALVYTVFEVLNSRGLDVSWFDRLKSMLMAIVFDTGSGNENETIDEIHKLWAKIYRIIGLRLGLSTESLRFAATLRSNSMPNRVLNEEDSTRQMIKLSEANSQGVISVTSWLKVVTEAVDDLTGKPRMNAVTRIAHARLVAVAISLSDNLNEDDKEKVLRLWESVTFRIFGMYRRDARTKIGDYVRLAWKIVNTEMGRKDIMKELRKIGEEYPIENAVKELREVDCYNGWREELRYFMYRYEEYLANKEGQNFNNEQWARIWESSATESIEHISPQSKGKKYAHWLGNLMLLPPRLNSSLGDTEPGEKAEQYRRTGLLIVERTVRRLEESGRWNRKEVRRREKRLLKWASKQWGK